MMLADSYLARPRGRRWFLGVGHAEGGGYYWGWVEEERATIGTKDSMLSFIEQFGIRADMELVPGPQCGCCGQQEAVRLVVNHPDPARRVIRCDKHLDRIPCLIEGCGRTFGLKGEEDYHYVTLCRTHWNSAPVYMRRRHSRLRRLAKRRGDPRIERMATAAWWRCAEAVQAGQTLDLSEIEKLFGP